MTLWPYLWPFLKPLMKRQRVQRTLDWIIQIFYVHSFPYMSDIFSLKGLKTTITLPCPFDLALIWPGPTSGLLWEYVYPKGLTMSIAFEIDGRSFITECYTEGPNQSHWKLTHQRSHFYFNTATRGLKAVSLRFHVN